jgi:hypothetical protein
MGSSYNNNRYQPSSGSRQENNRNSRDDQPKRDEKNLTSTIGDNSQDINSDSQLSGRLRLIYL